VPVTYSSLHVHVVFATRDRLPLIADGWRGDLHAYIGGILRTLEAFPAAIGGVADHVHILMGVRPTHRVADLVREAKKKSSCWAASREPLFAWQEGYGAFAVSISALDEVKAYIAGQAEHHRQIDSAGELRALLRDHRIAYEERYFA
jgi:putative transposase